ncbi:NAD(P)-dependent dehydrogenase, short-chain alcohol dehydrogenase family [Chitinophaga jiangningensis]|uniref:NAD(P)-dependent dehydrogenase, short-chain alcohol dehydrogenase family n=1 Tax=Chitinophaga jiangningensis TaxID=1419482 RepID=A0A1M7JTF0_9BACT|nr:SDR family oxidoreductase [Chitinophaga jiangningensis]SHM56185.1 NAD(P)-dependent dehydrogenase, short-chain alcohol dehydrogenase family [Chitinophaga jiangningensis]
MENLKDKVAVVFAASGQVGGAIARGFAAHGAKVYVTALNLAAVEALAAEIIADGGQAQAGKVDALNEAEIDAYIQQVVADNGRLDMVFNGIGSYYKDAGSGTPTTMATFEQFLHPLQRICGSQFLTSRVAAKYMIQTGSQGTLLQFTASMARSKTPNMAGFAAACAAIEGLTRVMAAEFGQHGIKSICIASGALLETRKIQGMITDFSAALGLPREQVAANYTRFDILKTVPTLKQLGETAAFLVSDNGMVFNSHIVDFDCGKLNIL